MFSQMKEKKRNYGSLKLYVKRLLKDLDLNKSLFAPGYENIDEVCKTMALRIMKAANVVMTSSDKKILTQEIIVQAIKNTMHPQLSHDIVSRGERVVNNYLQRTNVRSLADRCGLTFPPARVERLFIRPQMQAKYLRKRATILFTLALQCIVEEILRGASDNAEQAHRTRITLIDVEEAIKRRPELSKLSDGGFDGYVVCLVTDTPYNEGIEVWLGSDLGELLGWVRDEWDWMSCHYTSIGRFKYGERIENFENLLPEDEDEEWPAVDVSHFPILDGWKDSTTQHYCKYCSLLEPTAGDCHECESILDPIDDKIY
jgi:histone H3/H4